MSHPLTWWRMAAVAVRLAWPHLLAPWRSPILRWRMETYGFRMPDGHLLHAQEVTPGLWFRFLTAHRRALMQFLRWAATL